MNVVERVGALAREPIDVVGRSALVTEVVDRVGLDRVQGGRHERGLADPSPAVHHEELSGRSLEV